MKRRGFPNGRRAFCSRLLLPLLVVGGGFMALAMKQADDRLVVYCGRGEDLVGPLLARFEEQTGTKVQVRYGGTAELAVTLLEEGRNTPADVYMAQDAGALGALSKHGALASLPPDLLEQVPARFRSNAGRWVGISGRARVVVYNTDQLKPSDLPAELDGFCDPAWRGRIGWAPENGSFQSFVTALRKREGDEHALAWLRGVQANQPRVFAKNSAIVTAVAAGEIDVGFVNHYYLYSLRRSQPTLAAANYYFPGESAGSLVNVAGVGILAASKRSEAAEAFVKFLLSEESQRYFLEKTSEYPVIEAVPVTGDLQPLNLVPTLHIHLDDLDDLETTLNLIHKAGIL